MDRFVLKDPLPYRTIAMVVAGLAGVVVILLGDLLSEDEDGSGSASDDGSGCALLAPAGLVGQYPHPVDTGVIRRWATSLRC